MQPRPTIYKGTRMRSRLEARVAAFLDRERIAWAYEPVAFGDERGQYLPDFRVDGMVRVPLYVDVKGCTPTDEELALTFDRMSIIWSSEPDVFLAVWTAALFGVEGRFDIMFPGGIRRRTRVSRCGPCGGVTLRSLCVFCGRPTEPTSPLLVA